MDLKTIDFSQEREDFLTDWTEVIEPSPHLYDNVCNLIRCVTKLPDEEVQLPILVSYILCPSAMATQMPITFLCGQSGTGKSQVGALAAKIYQSTVFGATSTFTSIRNELDAGKWEQSIDDPEISYERNYLLVWDDIEADRIAPGATNDGVFSLLKSGVNRATSTIKIASSGGVNLEFNTFGGKIISSIHPIWDFPGLEELKRRALPIFFKKMDDVEYFVDIESVNVLDLYSDNKHFWLTDARRAEYKLAKRYFLSKKCSLKPSFKQMWCDIMATLYVHLLQTDSSITLPKIELIFEKYVSIREEKMKATMLSQVLQLYLQDAEEMTKKQNEEYINNGFVELVSDEVEVTSSEVFSFLKQRVNDGSVEVKRIDNTALHQLMTKNGFIQKPSKAGLIWSKRFG